MFSLKSIVLIAAAFVIGSEASGVAVPAVLAAPAVPAHVGYSQVIPQNVLPYASQVSVVNRALAAPYAVAAPAVAAPLSAPVPAPLAAPIPAPFAAPYPAPTPFAAPLAARFASPYSSPYFGIPSAAPVFPAPYATGYPYASPNFYPGPVAGAAFVR